MRSQGPDYRGCQVSSGIPLGEPEYEGKVTHLNLSIDNPNANVSISEISQRYNVMNALFMSWHKINSLTVTSAIKTGLKYLTGLFINDLKVIHNSVIPCLKQLAVKTNQVSINNSGRFGRVQWITFITPYTKEINHQIFNDPCNVRSFDLDARSLVSINRYMLGGCNRLKYLLIRAPLLKHLEGPMFISNSIFETIRLKVNELTPHMSMTEVFCPDQRKRCIIKELSIHTEGQTPFKILGDGLFVRNLQIKRTTSVKDDVIYGKCELEAIDVGGSLRMDKFQTNGCAVAPRVGLAMGIKVGIKPVIIEEACYENTIRVPTQN